jgi:ribosomal protein S18 acetylase RimI-like enzyme
LNVRPATVQDATAMAQIIAAVAPEGSLGAQPPVDVEARAERFREMITSEAAFVLEDEGRVVGAAAVDERHPGVLRLGMAILPEGRGRGGGRALLAAVETYARGRGAHKVDLETWTDNGRAIALYVSAGYVIEGMRRDHYLRRDGTLRSSLVMALFVGERPAL